MKRFPNQDTWQAAALLVLAAAAYALTAEFGDPLVYGQGGGVTPATWPRIVLVILAGASAFLLISSFFGSTQGAKGGSEEELDPAPRSMPLLITVLGFAIPVAYVVAMYEVGFLLATPPFLFAHMYVLGLHKWSRLIGTVITVYVLTVVIFISFLSLPLPRGVGSLYTLNSELISFIQ